VNASATINARSPPSGRSNIVVVRPGFAENTADTAAGGEIAAPARQP
jgi:hypothetical protein